LTVEDLRLLLGQQIGTEWLMPLALAHVTINPLAQGDFYPGDLLTGVLRTDMSYWSSHSDELQVLNEVRRLLMNLPDVPDWLLARDNWPAFD
jgi:hypothetical protein